METQITEFPKRKHPRMKFFDYSSNGSYFVTICVQNRKQILSSVVDNNVVLTPYGEIAKNELLNIEKRYSFLKIESYVIMPNHIHVLFEFLHVENKDSAGAKQPALQNDHLLQDVVSCFKSKSTKIINKQYNYGKVFQTSFYEHVINNQDDWSNTWDYIENNPQTWESNELATQ